MSTALPSFSFTPEFVSDSAKAKSQTKPGHPKFDLLSQIGVGTHVLLVPPGFALVLRQDLLADTH